MSLPLPWHPTGSAGHSPDRQAYSGWVPSLIHDPESGYRRSSERVVTITQVPESRSEDSARRNRNYIIAMGIRTACFLSLFIVPGVWRLLPLAGAVVLPVLAVMFANAIDLKRPDPVLFDEDPILALPAGEIIKGEVVEEHQ